MCSSAVVGAGDGLLKKQAMLDGDNTQAVPWEEQGPLGGDGTLELSPAVPQHRWPGVVAGDPLPDPCASAAEPGPCKPTGRLRTRVLGCVAGPQHPQGLVWPPCLQCWQLLPVLLLTSTPGWGARGWFPLHGAGTLH